MTIYFTRFVDRDSIRMLSLYYHELMGKIKQHERKNYLMVNDYMLDNIKRIDDTKILINMDNELPDYMTLKNVVILITCIIKGDGKF